jgi:carbonic anhydrase
MMRPSDQKSYEQIFENNRQWVASRRAQDPTYFEEMAKDQSPDFLYIGCADSRIPANEIMGLGPGEVFVHRNIANMVIHTDINAQSVIQYAVEALDVKHIIVCGHYGCGGINAAMQPKDLGLLNAWLREIRDVYRKHHPTLDVLDQKMRHRTLVELNVYEQCVNVMKTACVQKKWMTHDYPTVHGWVYDLGEGLIKDLKLPFEDLMQQIQRLYRLDT